MAKVRQCRHVHEGCAGRGLLHGSLRKVAVELGKSERREDEEDLEVEVGGEKRVWARRAEAIPVRGWVSSEGVVLRGRRGEERGTSVRQINLAHRTTEALPLHLVCMLWGCFSSPVKIICFHLFRRR